MSTRFSALSLVLGAMLVTASLAALWVATTDILLINAGDKRFVNAEQVEPGTRGWLEIGGCIRHDQGVVVAANGTVYRLGEKGPAGDDADRVYTPITARDDCDDDKPPRKVFALLEDNEGSETTLGRALVAPPSIAGIVTGTMGPRVGDGRRADRARAKIGTLPGIASAPVLHKGGRPGFLWVAIVTGAAGIHGLVLLAFGIRYVRRKRENEPDEDEAQFFRSETLD